MRFPLFTASLVALAVASPPLAAKPVHKIAPAAAHSAARKAAPAAQHREGIAIPADIRKAVDDPRRKPENAARDKYRHPAQTLSFFGLKPDMAVAEIMPGGGWYTEILAPYLAGTGQYIAAVPSSGAGDTFRALLASDPDRFGKAQVVPFEVGQTNSLAADGTLDMILTFRNIHNLLGSAEQPGDGNAPQAFADWYRALKPGGVLGIVEHRLPENMDSSREKTSGYVKRSTVIRLAMAAGFQFAGASDVNANPKDDHDHPKGVWTLPPSYALGDEDRAKYEAIGESDRMTLKFVKPDPDAGSADAIAAPQSVTPPAPASPDGGSAQ